MAGYYRAMNEIAMKRIEAITLLKMGIEFGVDEAVLSMPRDRFDEEIVKMPAYSTNPHQVTPKDPNYQAPFSSQNKSFGCDDEGMLAARAASKCASIAEITRAINEFPYFKKNTKDDTIEFYKGPTEPSIIIFREPEIYNSQTHNESLSKIKRVLFERIVNSIEITLSGGVGSVCGSVVTFPLCFDKTETNEQFNIQLMRPFLFRCINVLKPKVLITMGGVKLDNYGLSNGIRQNSELSKHLFKIEFPSLDVLVRAPKRKRDVWKKILELKKNFNGEKL